MDPQWTRGWTQRDKDTEPEGPRPWQGWCWGPPASQEDKSCAGGTNGSWVPSPDAGGPCPTPRGSCQCSDKLPRCPPWGTLHSNPPEGPVTPSSDTWGYSEGPHGTVKVLSLSHLPNLPLPATASGSWDITLCPPLYVPCPIQVGHCNVPILCHISSLSHPSVPTPMTHPGADHPSQCLYPGVPSQCFHPSSPGQCPHPNALISVSPASCQCHISVPSYWPQPRVPG